MRALTEEYLISLPLLNVWSIAKPFSVKYTCPKPDSADSTSEDKSRPGQTLLHNLEMSKSSGEFNSVALYSASEDVIFSATNIDVPTEYPKDV